MSKPTTLAIKKGTSFSEIEQFYDLLNISDTGVNLKIPIQLAYGGAFGIGSAIIQLIGSWSRSPFSASLASYSSVSGDSIFEQMLEHSHGLVAAYMSREIIGAQGNRIDRTNLLRYAANRVEAMHTGKLSETIKGPGVFLACFAGAQNEFLLPFYEHPDIKGVRGNSDFLHLTKDILSCCDHKFIDSMPSDWLNDIAVLIRELFENTNDHATNDEKNRKYTWTYPNVRGLLARKITIGYKGRLDIFKDGASALVFSKLKIQSDKPSVPMVELTVFDFGPGIAKRYLSIEEPVRELVQVPVEEERKIVMGAFSLNSSTKDGNGVGIGLDSVVKSLGRLNAFVRLRTGRLCLWQDFSRGTQQIELVDYFPNRPPLAYAAGTTFSILIPR